jgi:transposase
MRNSASMKTLSQWAGKAKAGLAKAGKSMGRLLGFDTRSRNIANRAGPSRGGHRGPKAVRVILDKAQREHLKRDARRRGMPYGVVVRARIVLELSGDPCITTVADRLDLDRKTVRHWRDRYLNGGRDALGTRHRRGRPVEIDAVSRCQVIGMACGKPNDFGVLHRATWTLDSLLETYRTFHPDLSPMSRTSLLRILDQAEIRPHRMQVWLHSPDPLFREKVTKVCALYLHAPAGSIVLCVDEKTSIQALERKHPTKPAKPGRDGRRDFEYIRHGTQALIASFCPQTGEVFGKVYEERGARQLVDFMEALARRYPDQDVHVVWDNLNTHYDGADQRWEAFNRRHGNRFHFHYTPIHASWVNQVEIFFGIVSRRVLRNAEHGSKEALAAALLAFLDHWNKKEKHPFRWTFSGYPSQIAQQAA